MTLVLTSPAFAANQAIPPEHTCDGDDSSPPLSWTDVPAGTKSLALIVDDPDCPDPAAPKQTWVHWVVWDIPAETTRLVAGASGPGLPTGSREGLNDSRHRGWDGPCPPIGRHRYVHRLYALDRVLGELREPSKAALLRAMEGHILDRAELIGTYDRSGRR